MESDQGQVNYDEFGPVIDAGPNLMETMELALNFSGGRNSVEGLVSSGQSPTQSSVEGTPVSRSDLTLPDAAETSDVGLPESPPLLIPCIHEIYGCKSVFKNYTQRTKHSKRCIYSILRWCLDSKCIANGTNKFDDLNALVIHSINEHGCVQMKNVGGEMILPIELSKKFLEHKAKDFNVRLLGTYEIDSDGKTFKILLMLLAKEKVVNLVVMSMQNSDLKREDYMRVMIGFTDSMDNEILVAGSFPHPSHLLEHGRKAVISADGFPNHVFEKIKKRLYPRFQKNDVAGLVDQSGIIKLKLKFNVEPLRCNLMSREESPLEPYMLTVGESGLNEADLRALFPDEPQGILPKVAGVLLPQLMDNADLLIECNEPNQVLCSCLAAAINFKNGKQKKGRMGRFWKVIVLFPNLALLRAQEKILQVKGKAAGLTVAYLVGFADEDFLDSVNDSDVILTTAEDLLVGNNSIVLLEMIKFLILPNADYLPKETNAPGNLTKCLELIPQKKKQKLVQIGICQDVNQHLISSLQEHFFKASFKAVSIGRALYDIQDMLQVTRMFTPSVNIVVNEAIEVIGGYEQSKSPKGGWLVLANERGDDYEEMLDGIEEKLNLLPEDKRWTIYRCNETDTKEQVPVVFDRFEQDSDGIVMLTSYFALHFEQLKQCGGIIVIKENEAVFGYLEMQQLYSFTIDAAGKKKPLFCLFD